MRLARQVTWAAWVALLLLTGAAVGASDVTIWNPSESYSGGKQFDPRLDKPMRFWRAGLTLAEVFGEIQRQTGVKLTFSPPDDANRDFAVHLFLNEHEPPELRALMAQLSWVTDCVFAVEGEEGKQVYALLHTSLGDGAEARLAKETATRRAAREEMPKRLTAKLEDLRQALQLPRDEVIARYRGKDDFLLLTLLEPARRAAAEVVCRRLPQVKYPDFITASVLEQPRIVITYIGALSPREEDRAPLATAFGLDPAGLPDDLNATFGLALRVSHTGGRPTGSLGVSAGSKLPEQVVVRVGDDTPMEPAQEVALRRLLGEAITPEQEAAYVSRRKAERGEQQSAARPSPRIAQVLKASDLDLARPASHPCWEIFAAAAKASGASVVADGMWWQEVSFGKPENAASRLSAVKALTALTGAEDGSGGAGPGWEWGDAGRMLRFRTTSRDMWRAARLPASALQRTDALLSDHLPKTGEAPSASTLTVPLDPAAWFPALGQLSKLQTEHGDAELYGNPAEPLTSARHGVLAELLSPLRGNVGLAPLVLSLRADQWRLLEGEGLDSERDLDTQQRKLLNAWLRRSEARRMEGCRFHLFLSGGEGGAPATPAAGRADARTLKLEASPLDADSGIQGWSNERRLWRKAVTIPLPAPPQAYKPALPAP